MTPTVRSAAGSDIGRRRAANQDSAYTSSRLLAVADGMGGHAHGEVASAVAINAVAEVDASLDGVDLQNVDLLSTLGTAMDTAAQRLTDVADSDPALRGTGTTLVALLLDGDHEGAVVHVGDSRAYRLRGADLEQLTPDHTLVADLLRNHEISEEEANTHPYRHVLTRALGSDTDIDAEVRRFGVEPGDLYVLCSDGVSGMLAEDELKSILVDHRDDPEAVCRELIAAANRAGGKDNATAIAVFCRTE
jgi:PPM family protein phosphatase